MLRMVTSPKREEVNVAVVLHLTKLTRSRVRACNVFRLMHKKYIRPTKRGAQHGREVGFIRPGQISQNAKVAAGYQTRLIVEILCFFLGCNKSAPFFRFWIIQRLGISLAVRLYEHVCTGGSGKRI